MVRKTQKQSKSRAARQSWSQVAGKGSMNGSKEYNDDHDYNAMQEKKKRKELKERMWLDEKNKLIQAIKSVNVPTVVSIIDKIKAGSWVDVGRRIYPVDLEEQYEDKKTLRGLVDKQLEPFYAKEKSKVSLTEAEYTRMKDLLEIKRALLRAGAKPKTNLGGLTLHYPDNSYYLAGKWAEKFSGGTRKNRRSKVRRTGRK